MRGLLLSTCDATSEIQLRSTSNGHNHLCFVEGSLRNDNWFLNTRDYLEIVRNDWNSWLWHRYSKLFARKNEVGNSWSLPVHSNSPSNIQSTNLTQKNSMANDQSKQFEVHKGRYRNFWVIILHVLSRPVMLFFVNKASLSDPNWTNSSPILNIYRIQSALQSFGRWGPLLRLCFLAWI